MIEITDTLSINENELQFEYIRSSGPGGQHVNKVSTAVQLRYDVAGSSALDSEVRARLTKMAGNRMTGDGILIITARKYRSQERNRQDAIKRLKELLENAAYVPKKRRKTRRTRGSNERRLGAKRHRARVKQQRSNKDPGE